MMIITAAPQEHGYKTHQCLQARRGPAFLLLI